MFASMPKFFLCIRKNVHICFTYVWVPQSILLLILINEFVYIAHTEYHFQISYPLQMWMWIWFVVIWAYNNILCAQHFSRLKFFCEWENDSKVDARYRIYVCLDFIHQKFHLFSIFFANFILQTVTKLFRYT